MSPNLLSLLKSHKSLNWLTTPEIFVLVVVILFGSYLAFRVPLGAGFDEETHLLRVWEMSAFSWIPNQRLATGMHFPAFYWDHSYRRQAILQPVDTNFWNIYANTPIQAMGFKDETLTTRSVYSPLLLLPQSLIMFSLGRELHLPALTVLIAIRLVGLFSYTLLVWLAVRLVPFAKWTLAILVVAPMAIYQASTVTTDTISNGLGFLFISGCLYIATLPQIRWREWATLVLLFFLLFWAKVNLTLLAILPFIILPPSRFKMKRGLLLLGLVAGLFALLEVGGWNYLAYLRFFTALPGANPSGQVQFIITHPFSAIWVLVSDIAIHILPYIRGWIADYGYGYYGVPWLIFPLYLLALLFTFIIGANAQPDKRTRTGLGIVFGLCFLATLMSLYVSYTPVGSAEIQGVHGRYFSVIFSLLFLGLIRVPSVKLNINRIQFARITIGITILGIFLYSSGMYLAFYVRCGTAYYQPGLCYQPVYKNWSPNANYFQPVTSQITFTQWIIPKCNGMSSLRVWVDSSGSDPNGKTEFILNDEENDVVAMQAADPNTDLPRQGWLTLTFPEDWKSGGKWYTLTVQNAQSNPGQGIRLASSIKPEYVDGPLLQNGSEIENDMIFQYGCIAGWHKLYSDVLTLVKSH